MAEPIVNEVLSNEPSSYTSLEWIELYNVGEAVSLDGYTLRIGDNTVILPSDITLESGEYYIICRRLLAGEISPGFESYWGNDTDYWGDSEWELSIQEPFEASFSLKNDSGTVELRYNGEIVSTLTWTESAEDGCSWERLTALEDDIAQSIDRDGSTPASVNSITPVERDLALCDVTVSCTDGMTTMAFEIANTGRNPVDSATLEITFFFIGWPTTLKTISLDPINAGDTVTIEAYQCFQGYYVSLAASLSPDDRDRNNSIEFTAVGREYPPLMLSEFLPNPQGDPGCEWIELYNRSDTTIDLYQWCIGDELRLCSIATDTLLLHPGEYIVLVQSETDFLISHPEFTGNCHEPSSWPSLNNDGDIVRLTDSFGIRADCFEYTFGYESDYTWCCEEYSSDPNRWGRSSVDGGTPGEENEVVFQQLMSDLKVTVEPKYISPDGDGFDESVTITIESPPADDYTVRIYDRQGRVVRHLFDDEPLIPSSIEWNGLSDSGRRLSIGPYILYVEAGGVGECKTTIVVAR